jgi:hypothetical protein
MKEYIKNNLISILSGLVCGLLISKIIDSIENIITKYFLIINK